MPRYCRVELVELKVPGEGNTALISVTFTGKPHELALACESIAGQLLDVVAGRQFNLAIIVGVSIVLRNIAVQTARHFAARVGVEAIVIVGPDNTVAHGELLEDRKTAGVLAAKRETQAATA